MNRYNWLAVVVCTAVYIGCFGFADRPDLFVNASGLFIVLSGTVGAMFLSYPAVDLQAALKVAQNSYTAKLITPEEIIDTLAELAIHTRRKGALAIEDFGEQTTVTFLRRALTLLGDGFKDAEIVEMLYNEMSYFQRRRIRHERVFRHGARLAPAFGVAGSVIGLIAMLGGMAQPDVILRTIPVALTSTLYGIVLANFVLTPVAESIHGKTQRELLLQKLITDGVVVIRQEPNPSRLAIRLESFLTPAARLHDRETLDDLRARIERMRTERAPGVSAP